MYIWNWALVNMGQLPTYILFENALEVRRFPEVDFEAKAFHTTPISKVIISFMELFHLIDPKSVCMMKHPS